MSGERGRPPESFVEQLKQEGLARYHHRHPFHVRMHEGRLTPQELRRWVLNRYYYQTRIPIKDALILAKSEDPAFRRAWVHRMYDHDGDGAHEGGLARWRRLGIAVGLDEETMISLKEVLPGVRLACDGYVAFVREAGLLEAVASSLTELFAPDLLTRRLSAWEQHYPWVDRQALDYFRSRIPRASEDAGEALKFIVDHATTCEQQRRCIAALIRKTEILWHVLDCVTVGEQDELNPQLEPTQIGA
jgi:pyrroloquinoline-quinone synthase